MVVFLCLKTYKGATYWDVIERKLIRELLGGFSDLTGDSHE